MQKFRHALEFIEIAAQCKTLPDGYKVELIQR